MQKKDAVGLLEGRAMKSIAEYGMIAPGDGVLLALSGGADSVALLRLLTGLRDTLSFSLYALHVHHGIRGDEADRDAEFCRALCEKLEVPFLCRKLDVPALAAKEKRGIEETARIYRYRTFFDFMRENSACRVLATAHNHDDNMETLLMNLCRGCGLSGISGIPALREELLDGGAAAPETVRIIRPLLTAAKADILAYCHAIGQDFVIDSTNIDRDFTRNRVRHEILPLLSGINEGYGENFRTAMTIAREADLYIAGEARAFLSREAEKHGRHAVGKDAVLSLPAALSSRALLLLYEDLCGRSLEYRQTALMRDFISRAEPGKYLTLPAGLYFYRRGDAFVMCQKEMLPSQKEYRYRLSYGHNSFPALGFEVFLFAEEDENYGDIRKNIYKLFKHTILNSVKMNGDIFIRPKRASDAYRFGGMTRSVKKLLSGKRIPSDLRQSYPVIEDGDGILWVPDFPCREGAGDGDGRKIILAYRPIDRN